MVVNCGCYKVNNGILTVRAEAHGWSRVKQYYYASIRSDRSIVVFGGGVRAGFDGVFMTLAFRYTHPFCYATRILRVMRLPTHMYCSVAVKSLHRPLQSCARLDPSRSVENAHLSVQ